MSVPAVAIGILNWNGRSFLEQFLPSVCSITYSNFTVYVIDNDSSDDSIAFVRQHYPQVQIIQTGGNLGFGGGYNAAIAQLHEPYVLMLNSDIEVTPDFLQPMVTLMEQDATIGACQSKLLAYHNKTQFEYGGAAGGSIDLLGYTVCRGRIFDTVETDHNQYPTAPVFWGGGSCLLVRRTAYEQVQGMYAYYFMHFEEIDLCWKLNSEGYKVYCCNESVVYHVGGGSLDYQSPRKTYYNFRNNLVMCWRNLPALYLLWWLPARVALDIVAALSFAPKKQWKNIAAVGKAYRHFIYWLFTENNKLPAKTSSLLRYDTVYKGSVIFSYFIRGKKTFSRYFK